MSTSIANITAFLNCTSLKVLRLLRYTVPTNQCNQGLLKASFSYVIPTLAAVLSFCMLEVAILVFFADVVGLLYQFFTSVFSYQSYQRSFEKESSVALSLRETPLLIRSVVLFVLIVVILIIITLTVVSPSVVTVNGAWMICACVNIVVTWVFEVVDSLVAIYGAEIASEC